jgi:hypothetical protein
VPRCIRNFWLEASIDGRRSRLASGPRSKDGGFCLQIQNRDHGDISPDSLRIVGRCTGDTLKLTVENGDKPIFEKKASR